MNRSAALVLLAAFALAGACTKAGGPKPDALLPSARIDTDDLRRHITAISSDAFQGRGPGTPGDVAARAYIVQQLQALGLTAPGPDGQWEQPFDMLSVTAAMPPEWSFTRGQQTRSLAWHDQYVATSGVHTTRGAIEDAEVVFVGYGIEAPEYHWDDFKGQDVRGKILLMLNNDPDWDPQLFAGKTRLYYGRWSYKYESAARHGAAGAIIIHTTESAGYPFGVLQTAATGPQFELTDEPVRTTIEAWITEAAARSLVALANVKLSELIECAKHREFRPVALGIKTSIAFDNRVTTAKTANVFGVVRGHDPRLKNQLVVYSAHHDHLGVGEPDARGDRIYNGALDNATGVAQLLSIAKAFQSEAAPRRSVMFLFVGGEEQGLLGSRYFVAHPTVPLQNIAANLNYDSGNIWGTTNDVTFVGLGKSSLDRIVIAAAAAQNRTVEPDEFPDRGFFYRSDQFSFAKAGIPAAFLGPGTSFIGRPEGWGRQQIEDYETHHYHQPSDELTPAWNFEGMVEDTELGFAVGRAIANEDAMPAWVPGDEFATARAR